LLNLKNKYSRKKKTKKTQKVQHADDDNHPVHTNAIGNRGVVAFSQGGSVSGNSSATLSGSIPYLCFTTKKSKIYKIIKNCYKSK